MSKKTFTSDMSGTPDNSHYQQFVLNRANMTDPFSDNDYNSCIEALEKNNAVAINWNQGTVRQLQLVTKSNTGILKFAYVHGNVVETWTVAASSPHDITNTSYEIDNSIIPTLNTGTKIAEGIINGQHFKLFAPSGGGGSQVQLVQYSQQISINAGAVSFEHYDLNASVPAGKQFVGTLTISAIYTSQGSGAYTYNLDVPGASMKCIFGTYPAMPGSGHTIGMSVDNSDDTQSQLYFELSGTFESQTISVHVNGIIF